MPVHDYVFYQRYGIVPTLQLHFRSMQKYYRKWAMVFLVYHPMQHPSLQQLGMMVVIMIILGENRL